MSGGKVRFFWMVCMATASILFACAEKEKPKDILSHAQMVTVLRELYEAEERLNTLPIQRDSSLKIFELWRGRVFEKAGYSDSVFKKSFEFYMDRPEEMELIYSALVDTLQLQEQRVQGR